MPYRTSPLATRHRQVRQVPFLQELGMRIPARSAETSSVDELSAENRSPPGSMSTRNDSLDFFTTDPFHVRHCAATFCSFIVIPHRHWHIRIMRSTYNLAARSRLMQSLAGPAIPRGIVITSTSVNAYFSHAAHDDFEAEFRQCDSVAGTIADDAGDIA